MAAWESNKNRFGTKRRDVSQPDLWRLYREMLQSRLFEEAVSALWDEGLISGEMHLGIGEEAIIAGTVLQLRDGDSMALDHRGTAAMLMRGVEPAALMRELLGHKEGICSGMGGHMHLFSREHLAASSGIVGSSGPAGAGFALAGRYLRPGSITLAFFGEGAINEGMMMESMNLARVWSLPVIFICKDNNWSITTHSSRMTAGDLVQRARGFDMPAFDIDGSDIEHVWQAGSEAIKSARDGMGPSFIRATCRHFEGHFSGYQLLRLTRKPAGEREIVAPLLRSLFRWDGTSLRHRVESVRRLLKTITGARSESQAREDDPLRKTRRLLVRDESRLNQLEASVVSEVHEILDTVLV